MAILELEQHACLELGTGDKRTRGFGLLDVWLVGYGHIYIYIGVYLIIIIGIAV